MWYNSQISNSLKYKRDKSLSAYRKTNQVQSSSWKNIKSERLFSHIADSTAALHAFADDQKLLDFALDSLLSMTEAKAGSIFIWDEASKELVLRTAQGPYLSRSSGTRLKLREGISGWVAEQGRSVLVKDVEVDDRFHEIKRHGKYQSRSFISLPILAHSKLVGVINITEKRNLEPFAEEDFERVNSMAKHVAIAYENIKTERRLWQENEELTERVTTLNERLKKQEPLASLGKLAANLAHELNNPLDGIRRFINLSLDQVKEETLAREYLIKAKGGVRRAIQVIRGLLAFSSQTSKQLGRTAEVHRVLEQSIHAAQQNPSFKGVRFKTKFYESPVHVRDVGLATVLQNLFENACHAMNFSGSIHVKTEKKDSKLVILVKDSGAGVAEEIRKRIFEPFFTTKPQGKGTGIGLSICRDVVERSGGTIECESAAGHGTTFILKLPYYTLLD